MPGVAHPAHFSAVRKFVWLKNASFLADSGAGRSESVARALERLCAVLETGLPEGVSFLLSAPLADKRRTGFKSLSKLATTAVYDLPNLGFRGDEEAIVEWTAVRAREHGLQLRPDAVDILAARVGLNPLQLESELEKLETAFGTGTQISSGDMRLLVPQTREGGIFDLSDAILQTRPFAGARNARTAVSPRRTWHRHSSRGRRPDRAQSSSREGSSFQTPLVPSLAAAVLCRHPQAPFPGRAPRIFPRKKDGTISVYPLGIAAIDASRYSLASLEAGFAACAAANQQLLSGTLTDAVIIERFLIDLLVEKKIDKPIDISRYCGEFAKKS